MTVGGYVFFAIFAIIIFIVACVIAYESIDSKKPWLSAIAIFAAMVLIISVFFGMRWYFHSTESGKRAIKTQESNFEGGIKRSVKVYDAIGNLLQEYEGKFDVDFNGDGKVDNTNDQAPYGYTGNPEHTYNATIGWEWKGFSWFAQFYGVTGVTRDVGITSFNQKLLTVYDNGTWWNPVDNDGDVVVPRFNTQVSYNDGTQYLYDGSYFRLKNVEVAYTWTKGWIKKLGFSSLKIYLNGNNLFLITKMPDDREGNLGGFSGGGGAYPTVRRYNFGIKLNI